MAENDMHYNADLSQTATSDDAPRTDLTSDAVANDDFRRRPGNGNNGADNDYGLVTPLPDFEEGPPAYPGDMTENGNTNNQTNRPNRPNRPGNNIVIPTIPVFPSIPIYPNYPSNPTANYGQVRFLNASANLLTIDISIDGSAYVNRAGFASLSDYDWISDGFHTVTIRSAVGLRSILLQQTFPFTAGQKVTMVLTDAADGGLELVRVVDTGCSNLPNNTGCFRFANMAYAGLNLDLLLGNQTVFRNIGYQGVSNYKQAVAGNYQFMAATASSYSYIRELPIIVIGTVGTNLANRQNVLSFNVDIDAGKNYTAYLIGNTWSNARLQVITAQD